MSYAIMLWRNINQIFMEMTCAHVLCPISHPNPPEQLNPNAVTDERDRWWFSFRKDIGNRQGSKTRFSLSLRKTHASSNVKLLFLLVALPHAIPTLLQNKLSASWELSFELIQELPMLLFKGWCRLSPPCFSSLDEHSPDFQLADVGLGLSIRTRTAIAQGPTFQPHHGMQLYIKKPHMIKLRSVTNCRLLTLLGIIV